MITAIFISFDSSASDVLLLNSKLLHCLLWYFDFHDIIQLNKNNDMLFENNKIFNNDNFILLESQIISF